MAVAVAAGGAAIVVGLAVASWSGDAGGLGCLALFGLVFAVAFSAAWAKRESFVVITQRMLAVRSIAIPLSEIVSVQVEEYVNGDGKGNGTSNMRFVGLDGRSTEIHYRGDPKRVTAVLETLGIATAAATLLEPASSSEG